MKFMTVSFCMGLFLVSLAFGEGKSIEDIKRYKDEQDRQIYVNALLSLKLLQTKHAEEEKRLILHRQLMKQLKVVVDEEAKRQGRDFPKSPAVEPKYVSPHGTPPGDPSPLEETDEPFFGPYPETCGNLFCDGYETVENCPFDCLLRLHIDDLFPPAIEHSESREQQDPRSEEPEGKQMLPSQPPPSSGSGGTDGKRQE